ncbi:MAG: hypothetical protein SPL75_03900 [Bacilli bacterium]|nr:hypothetical protein [Bacilli bacterium]
MASNNGHLNELLISEAINGKKLAEINLNLQSMLKTIFPSISANDVISSKVIDDYNKPDIVVSFGERSRYISIKSGHSNEVHSEYIDSLMDYLRLKRISEETIETLRLFQYGDGTTDGSGTTRMNTMELNYHLQKRIKKANEELNKSYDFIYDFVVRTMIQGRNEEAPAVDYFYIGTQDYGSLCCIHQLKTYVYKKCWNFFNCIHIGPIFIKPRARYADKKINSDRLRQLCVCYWPNLAQDIDYLAHRYTFIVK